MFSYFIGEQRQRKGSVAGFTLIELLVVVAIVGLLAAILFPVFARAREKARQASCMSNLKQIGLAFMMYTQDYDEHMPPGGIKYPIKGAYTFPNGKTATGTQFRQWYSLIFDYTKNYQVFTCPSVGADLQYDGGYAGNHFFSYSYNYKAPVPANPPGRCTGTNPYWDCGVDMGPTNDDSSNNSGASLAAIEDPAGTILVTEGSEVDVRFYKYINDDTRADATTVIETGECTHTTNYYASCLRARHSGAMNTIFADGHVKAMQWQRILGSDSDPNVVKYWTTAANPVN